MGDTDALRDKIAQAIAEKFTSPTRVVTRSGKRYDPITLEDYTEAVPMEERIEQGAWVVFEAVDGLRSLRAANSYEIADAVLPVVTQETAQALSVLRSRVEALADELDNEVQTITNRDAGALGRRGALRDAVQRLRRSLSDNKEQQ